MEKVEMSVQRALSELKMLDKRIDRRINESVFIGAKKGKKLVDNFNDENELTDKVKSDYQAIKDLIARRNSIKTAIVQSNAVTPVNIGKITYSVAEAIERKSSIDNDRHLLNRMKSEYAAHVRYVERENEQLQITIDNQLNQMFASESKKDESIVKSITKTLKEENEAKLVDPIKLSEQIEQLEVEIEEFEAEVDHILVESNTITKILV